MNDALGATPSQTVGPFLSIGLLWDDGADLVADGTPGAITVSGLLSEGTGAAVPDGLVEIWQADPDGRFPHPDDPRGASKYPGFRNFGRAGTDPEGRFWFRTLRPGPVPTEDGVQTPHLNVTVFARGLLKHLVTRLYFPEPDNSTDPVLCSLPESDRALLTAVADGPARYRFDIRLQGERETPFFHV
ncbi:MAG: protocatechuate 3,4-dioxygenase subunit alpha [Actinomycetota bacterium]|nr:protocatechuate 3,4-dioxygenase subunit alpha [Actinomycetota bacterium]